MATFTWVEDKGLSKETVADFHEALFGDNYSQRLSNSINPLVQTFNVSFVNRPNVVADEIIEFLEEQKGVETFDWTPTGYLEPIKVTCSTWNDIWTSPSTKSVSAVFIRRYGE